MTGTAVLDRLVSPGADGDPGARGWLAAHGLPRSRDEAWRYTPLDEIVTRLEQAGAPPAAGGDGPAPLGRDVLDRAALDREAVDRLAGDHGGPCLVFVDGIYAPELSRPDVVVPGLWCGNVAAVPDRRRRQVVALPPPDELARFDGFQALNRLVAPDAAVVRVDAGVVIDAPVHVVHIAIGAQGPTAVHPRAIVTLAEGARAAFIETFTGVDGVAGADGVGGVDGASPTTINASTTVVVGPGAHLTHHRIQREPAGAVHVGHTRIAQAADSQVRSVSVMLGADIARHAVDVALGGPDARADLDGLYLPGGRQRHDNLVTVDHSSSGCTSSQRYRGVVGGEARGSFGGHIIVRPDTTATDARQSNRNLVLSRTAQADTRPWLEILADDVACSHGATVGRLDDDALFYLRSRGIPRAEARAMLVQGFVGEITEAITPQSLREHVAAAVTEPGGSV
jgi:Fe-S cluster assembly protein SufD